MTGEAPATGEARLVLVRHGETSGQSSIRLYGRTDLALSDLGRRQMRRVGEALEGSRFARVLTTPLDRARESTAIILGAGELTPEVVPGWTEIDFGAWEGWTWDEVRDRDPDGLARYTRSGTGPFTFPDGDSRHGFEDRVRAAADAWLHPDDPPTLVVAHKGVIKVILGHLLGLEPPERRALPVHLGSIHRITVRDGKFDALELNRVDHLGDDHVPDAAPGGAAPG